MIESNSKIRKSCILHECPQETLSQLHFGEQVRIIGIVGLEFRIASLPIRHQQGGVAEPVAVRPARVAVLLTCVRGASCRGHDARFDYQ